MRIKRNGITIYIEQNYDYNNEVISDMLKNYDGSFHEKGFSTPELLRYEEIAQENGFQIVEDTRSNEFYYLPIKKGKTIKPEYYNSYDLVTYGVRSKKNIEAILKNINNHLYVNYYNVSIEDLDGDIIDSLVLSFEKDIETISIEDIIKEIENYIDLPETFKKESNEV
jgi:uncharacterized protein YlxP (DUF503 family)